LCSVVSKNSFFNRYKGEKLRIFLLFLLLGKDAQKIKVGVWVDRMRNYYHELAEKDSTQEENLNGWLNRVNRAVR